MFLSKATRNTRGRKIDVLIASLLLALHLNKASPAILAAFLHSSYFLFTENEVVHSSLLPRPFSSCSTAIEAYWQNSLWDITIEKKIEHFYPADPSNSSPGDPSRQINPRNTRTAASAASNQQREDKYLCHYTRCIVGEIEVVPVSRLRVRSRPCDVDDCTKKKLRVGMTVVAFVKHPDGDPHLESEVRSRLLLLSFLVQ